AGANDDTGVLIVVTREASPPSEVRGNRAEFDTHRAIEIVSAALADYAGTRQARHNARRIGKESPHLGDRTRDREALADFDGRLAAAEAEQARIRNAIPRRSVHSARI